MVGGRMKHKILVLSKQIHVAGAKRGKTCASNHNWFWFTSDWLSQVTRDILANHKAYKFKS